jgi:hypothetical protein
MAERHKVVFRPLSRSSGHDDILHYITLNDMNLLRNDIDYRLTIKVLADNSASATIDIDLRLGVQGKVIEVSQATIS